MPASSAKKTILLVNDVYTPLYQEIIGYIYIANLTFSQVKMGSTIVKEFVNLVKGYAPANG